MGTRFYQVPRERVSILTKTTARSAEQMKADLDRFRREMDTEAWRLAVTRDAVHCFTIGFESRAEFLDNFGHVAADLVLRCHLSRSIHLGSTRVFLMLEGRSMRGEGTIRASFPYGRCSETLKDAADGFDGYPQALQ
jgi:hypothetical protein